MICYRDKTFCPFWKDCESGEKCKIKFTEQIEKDAEEFGLPVMVYTEKPECFIKKEGIKDENNSRKNN